jgi:hypothetical protein
MKFANEITRELPMSPLLFGITAFAILSLLLYIVLRIDKD